MKTFKTLVSLTVILAAFSCAKGPSVSDGYVTFAVSADEAITDVTKGHVSDYAQLPQSTDFSLEIEDASGASFWNGKITDWDPATVIPAGVYTVTASYGNLEDEGFGKPYFTGTESFEVKGGETAEISVPVALGNTLIRIRCSENFKNYYKDYSFVLYRGNVDIAEFVKDETRAAFFDGYKVSLRGTMRTETGAEKTFAPDEYTNLAPATIYTLELDVANIGSSAVTVTFNNTVETVELGDVELND